MSKVLVIGLDGATFDIIRPLVADGRLPNLSHIMKHGAWGTLKSTIPSVTPAAWTSMFTGKNPGKHGIFDFQRLNRETYHFRSVRTDKHREMTMWDLLGAAGKNVIITDVPFTYPPRPLNGWMITGYATPRTPDTIFTYPVDLAQHLPADLRSEIKVALPDQKFERSQRFIEVWQEIMNGRRQLLTYLIKERPWDLFMHVFSITDNMAHVFWTYVDPAHPNYYKPEGESYREAFLQGYEMCDQILGELMELAGPDTTTLVLSDHGFGSVRPRQYIFQRLLRGGFIKPQRKGVGKVMGDAAMNLALSTYRRFPVLREVVKNLRPGRREVVKRTLRRAGALPNAAAIDYGRSQVIAANSGLQIWANEKKTFAQGIVPSNQKETLLNRVSQFLRADIDQTTGQPIIATTYRGKDLYKGPYTNRGADLVLEYTNFFKPDAINPPQNPRIEGGHTLDGIFLAYGPPVQAGNSINNASLIDVAPTILHLLGQEIPPDFDGHVLTETFRTEYQHDNPIRYGTKPAQRQDVTAEKAYTEAEEAELKEQLRQLGYL